MSSLVLLAAHFNTRQGDNPPNPACAGLLTSLARLDVRRNPAWKRAIKKHACCDAVSTSYLTTISLKWTPLCCIKKDLESPAKSAAAHPAPKSQALLGLPLSLSPHLRPTPLSISLPAA